MMVQTFNSYNKGNATIQDVIDVWNKGQLPQKVVDYFDDTIVDVNIRSLHQSNFKLFKNSLVVDNYIEIGRFFITVTRGDYDWQVIFHKEINGQVEHLETTFVKNSNNLLYVLKSLIEDYK